MGKNHHCCNKTNGQNQFNPDREIIGCTIDITGLKNKKWHTAKIREGDQITILGFKKKIPILITEWGFYLI